MTGVQVTDSGPPDGYGYCHMGGALLMCFRCSALVCDAGVHDDFHASVAWVTRA
jgi:hypothetical protein